METDLPPYGPPQSGFAHQRAGRLHRKDQTVSLDPHLSGECRSEIPIAFPDQCHRLFPAPLINPVVGLLAPAGRTQSSRSLRIQTALQAPDLPGRQPQFPGCRNLAHRPGLQPLKHAVSFQFPFAQANLLLRHVHFLLKRTLLLGTDRTLPLGSNTRILTLVSTRFFRIYYWALRKNADTNFARTAFYLTWQAPNG